MVEEDEFRSTYHSVNQRRCVFEKAILNRYCACFCSMRFFLADREGISCEAADAHKRCDRLNKLLHNKARFALKLKSVTEELPHTQETKVQSGGLLGLQRLLYPQLEKRGEVNDIAGLLAYSIKAYGLLENIPFQEIIKSIVSFEGRRRRPRSKRH